MAEADIDRLVTLPLLLALHGDKNAVAMTRKTGDTIDTKYAPCLNGFSVFCWRISTVGHGEFGHT